MYRIWEVRAYLQSFLPARQGEGCVQLLLGHLINWLLVCQLVVKQLLTCIKHAMFRYPPSRLDGRLQPISNM